MELLTKIGNLVYTNILDLSIEAYVSKEPLEFENKEQGNYKQLQIGESWGELFDTAWIKLSGTIPVHNSNKQLVLLIDVGGEGLVFDDRLKVLSGITNKKSSYGIPPDKPGKWVVELNGYSEGEQVIFWVDASCNDLMGYVQDGGRILNASFGLMDKRLKKLYYDIEVIHDWINSESFKANNQPSGVGNLTVSKKDFSCAVITRLNVTIKELQKIMTVINDETIKKAEAILDEFYKQKSTKDDLDIRATGHAHLDIAWLWPIREGRRKAARTFATAIKNMNLYDDYIFGASQYQLFEWIKNDYSDLFGQIKKKVREGQFELQGTFWVESDLNIPSGESLIRQIIYGKKFLEEEFNTFVDYLWLPDVFGFNGSLPQILKKSGVNYLCSQKLSQNNINKFPHHSFKWKGIDGTDLIVHHFPEDTYDSRARATSSVKLEKNYIEKDIAPTALMVYGVGDGGGGPGEEHIERLTRIKDLKGLPKLKSSRVDRFLEKLATYEEHLPIIEGELYFEKHQGTYTTEALSKQYNRDMEYALRTYEILLSLFESDYDKTKLDDIWKQVLLYQFHDILPGTSIMRVYHNTRNKYKQLLLLIETLISDLLDKNKSTHKSASSFTVFNLSPVDQDKWLKVKNQWQKIHIKKYSLNTFEYSSYELTPVKQKDSVLENDHIKVQFDAYGNIISYLNKDLMYDFIDHKRVSNSIRIFVERDEQYPAWDFEQGYREQVFYPKYLRKEVINDGPKSMIKYYYKYNKSVINMEYALFKDAKFLEITCDYNWKDIDTTVKIAYPITVESRTALCNIQFGNIERPTHSDDSFAYAKDEVCAHKFIDVSDHLRGIALLSRNKYGFRVKDKELEMTVLRSQKKNGSEIGIKDDKQYIENNFGDIVSQRFKFALFTHKCDNKNSILVQESYKFNHDLIVIENNTCKEQTPIQFIDCDRDHVILESIKPLEDQSGILLRIYEATGKEGTFKLNVNINYKVAYLSNLVEERIKKVDLNKEMSIKPYEILSIILIR